MNQASVEFELEKLIINSFRHDPEILLKYSARIVLLSSGEVIYQDHPAKISGMVGCVNLFEHRKAFESLFVSIMNCKKGNYRPAQRKLKLLTTKIARQLCGKKGGLFGFVASKFSDKLKQDFIFNFKFFASFFLILLSLSLMKDLIKDWQDDDLKSSETNEPIQPALQENSSSHTVTNPVLHPNALNLNQSQPAAAPTRIQAHDYCAAPNRQPWPAQSAYLKKMRVRDATGLSQLTIDNSQIYEDVYVKVVNKATQRTARNVLIKANDRYTLVDFSPGEYQVFAKFLSPPCRSISKTDIFSLNEQQTYDGTVFSNITLTLYKVQDGNMQSTAINEEEFNAAQ